MRERGQPAAGVAKGYELLPQSPTVFSPSSFAWTIVDGSGLDTTVLDALKWAENLMSGEVGGQPFLDLFAVAGPYPPSSRYFNPGPGEVLPGAVRFERGGVTGIFVGGRVAGWSDALLIVPERRAAVAVSCNLFAASPGLLAARAADAWLGTSFEP